MATRASEQAGFGDLEIDDDELFEACAYIEEHAAVAKLHREAMKIRKTRINEMSGVIDDRDEDGTLAAGGVVRVRVSASYGGVAVLEVRQGSGGGDEGITIPPWVRKIVGRQAVERATE